MNERTQELLTRTFQFSLDLLRKLESLPKDDTARIIRNQITRSGTSIGANYEEARAAQSRKDFHHKISIVLKECHETNYWIRLMSEHYSNQSYQHLEAESLELKKIFTKIKMKTGAR